MREGPDGAEADKVAKARQIIEMHFDLEIERKFRDLEIINFRMEECKHLLSAMHENWEENRASKKRKKKSKASKVRKGRKKAKSGKKTKKKSNGLYVRRNDGAFLQMICPACKKESFATQLGFVNHCRILHKIKFASYGDAAIHCGKEVDSSVVPPDHPCRQQHSTLTMLPSVSLPASTSTSEETSSRFHVKKRIIVGNTSKYIQPKNKDKEDRATHKWMVYVRGGPEEPNISHYVQKVRFFLHPSFAPNDVVDVISPPFHLTRRGWGEFPIRAQLHFVDATNKPVDIIHSLKFDHTKSGLQMLGGETCEDVELNKKFFDDQQSQSSTTTTTAPSKSEQIDTSSVFIKPEPRYEDDVDGGGIEAENQGTIEGDATEGAVKAEQNEEDSAEEKAEVSETEEPEDRMEEQHETDEAEEDTASLLRAVVEQHPLLDADRHHMSLPYSFARTIEEWNSWNVGKRKAVERQRARNVQRKLQEIGVNLTTKSILVWCRTHGYVPQYKELPKVPPVFFCKFCGCPHEPAEFFESLQKLCRKRLSASATIFRPGGQGQLYLSSVASSRKGLPRTLYLSTRLLRNRDSFFTWKNENHSRGMIMIWIKFILHQIGIKLEGEKFEEDFIVQAMLYRAALLFMKGMINAGYREYVVQKKGDDVNEVEGKVLVPYHIFLALSKNSMAFDFLLPN
eukprot:TRINITY_DN2206_c0_g2_i1.p1 TRINITY_DN2206_c0_g2~~TRINITY_DN2206_c0_g2_i1.p1  ORF type:complete len:681 (+),score=117.61 TRINITY_DN2206_c0_g2_i1:3-2045(+)